MFVPDAYISEVKERGIWDLGSWLLKRPLVNGRALFFPRRFWRRLSTMYLMQKIAVFPRKFKAYSDRPKSAHHFPPALLCLQCFEVDFLQGSSLEKVLVWNTNSTDVVPFLSSQLFASTLIYDDDCESWKDFGRFFAVAEWPVWQRFSIILFSDL